MKEKKFFIPEIYPPDKDLKKKWFVSYYEPLPGTNKGRRIRVYDGINRLKTIPERLELADKISCRILLKRNKVVFEKRSNKTPESILLQTLEANKHYLRKKSFTTYHGQILKFIEYLGNKKDLNATRTDALQFVQHLFSSGLSPKTVKTYQQNLKTIYTKYIVYTDNETFKNPFRNMPTIKSESKSLHYFNDDQIYRIKQYLIANDPVIWLACQLQYYCFIRPNELRQLKAENFNLSAGYIEIYGSFSKNKKTQKVSIPSSFISDLQFIYNYKSDQYIFPGKKDSIPLSRNIITNRHKKALKACNITGHYSLYSWKHTGAVKAVLAGIQLKDLQLQLRHHSLDMVNEYLKNLGVMDMDRIRDLFPGI